MDDAASVAVFERSNHEIGLANANPTTLTSVVYETSIMIHTRFASIVLTLCSCWLSISAGVLLAAQPRVIVLTDISAPHQEPDDQQSLVRLLVYSNEIELAGIIATTSTWRREELHAESIRLTLDAYEKVHDNLRQHADGFPPADSLRAVVHTGQTAYGMAAVGEGQSTAGSRHIVTTLLEESDQRPVWILIWGGANTLAQALRDVRQQQPEDLPRLMKKLRVYEIGGQDDAGAWALHEFPQLFWIRSQLQWRGISHRLDQNPRAPPGMSWEKSRGGPENLFTAQWVEQNIRTGHGPLGAVYPPARFLHEGDSPSLLYLLADGLSDPEQLDWGSWGGRFSTERKRNVAHTSTSMGKEEHQWHDYAMFTDAADTWSGREVRVERTTGRIVSQQQVTYQQNRYAPLFRWREAFQNDFAARIDWSATADFEQANHNPIAIVNQHPGQEVIRLTAHAGERLQLDASTSHDPDGDQLTIAWFHYPEASESSQALEIGEPDSAITSLTIPEINQPQTYHVILEVSDNGTPRLRSYRRVIVTARP